MADEPLSVVFTPEFKRNLRRLAKKYGHIRDHLEPIINQLARGETPGDRVKGVADPVYKTRAPNSDARKGKSGGYRIIYHLKAPRQIVLITLYSKSDQADVSSAAIRRIIAAHQKSGADESEGL